jgi:formyltetrahydrofolate hydrolase
MSNHSVVFMGGKQAGCLGLLTLCAVGLRPALIIAYDEQVRLLAKTMELPWVSKLPQDFTRFDGYDLLVSVHGREIVKPATLARFRHAVNVHPCLRDYPGKDPVGRLIDDDGKVASIAAHVMTAEIDAGEILAEEAVSTEGIYYGWDCPSREECTELVYNRLYPLYPRVLLAALRKLGYAV